MGSLSLIIIITVSIYFYCSGMRRVIFELVCIVSTDIVQREGESAQGERG